MVEALNCWTFVWTVWPLNLRSGHGLNGSTHVLRRLPVTIILNSFATQLFRIGRRGRIGGERSHFEFGHSRESSLLSMIMVRVTDHQRQYLPTLTGRIESLVVKHRYWHIIFRHNPMAGLQIQGGGTWTELASYSSSRWDDMPCGLWLKLKFRLGEGAMATALSIDKSVCMAPSRSEASPLLRWINVLLQELM